MSRPRLLAIDLRATYLEKLEQLRSRNLSSKRSLAVREFALGVEALERFVRREPLRRVHECVYGVWRSRANQWTRACEQCGIRQWFGPSSRLYRHSILWPHH